MNRTPDLQNLLNDQSRLMAAATAAGEAVARDIGTYADKKREAAQKLADATTDPELKAQYQKEADDWKEGGDYRAVMHAAGGAIIAGLGGGNALGGALGAGLTSKLGGALNELSDNIQKAHPTGNADIDQALAQIVATGVGTAVGAAVGGSSGAFTGYNVDRFNRQLHEDKDPRKDERKRIQQDIAPQFAAAHPGMTVEQATQILADQLLRQVDTTAAGKGGWNQEAANYLNNYAAAHAGETVGKDQWGNAVPLFGNAAGYQRNDSTIFSANPQTEIPPPTLGLGSLGSYFKGVGHGLADTLGHPLDTIWSSLKGVYVIATDPVAAARLVQDAARNMVMQAGNGNFTPAGQQVGLEIGTFVVDMAGGVGAGAGVSKAFGAINDLRAMHAAVTSDGMANAATLPGLKAQLVNENLVNIAARDPRLRVAVNGSGTSNPNFSVGSGSVADANALGQVWVGDGAKLVSNQAACPGCLVSADGTMIYRPPQPKTSPFATTGVQANFVRQTPSGTIISNGHLNVIP
ncbi:hypothetical protein AL486_09170 [Pandoraea apista]|nr:hypothetical protein AL486_09170 [Pandoraea apista]